MYSSLTLPCHISLRVGPLIPYYPMSLKETPLFYLQKKQDIVPHLIYLETLFHYPIYLDNFKN